MKWQVVFFLGSTVNLRALGLLTAYKSEKNDVPASRKSAICTEGHSALLKLQFQQWLLRLYPEIVLPAASQPPELPSSIV